MFFSKLRNNHALIFRLTLFILTSVIIVLMLPKKGTFKYEFKKGNPWLHETLISSYDFPILKSNEDLLKEKNEIINNQKITLVFDNVNDKIMISQLVAKDKKNNAKKFLKELGNPYNLIAKDEIGKKSVNFGIYGIPESILVNKEMIVIKKYIGPLNTQDYNEILKIIN